MEFKKKKKSNTVTFLNYNLSIIRHYKVQYTNTNYTKYFHLFCVGDGRYSIPIYAFTLK